MRHTEDHWLDIATRKLQYPKDWILGDDQCPHHHPDPKKLYGKYSVPRLHQRDDNEDDSPDGGFCHQGASNLPGKNPSASGGQANNGESSRSQGGNDTSRNYAGHGYRYQPASQKANQIICNAKLSDKFGETPKAISLESIR